jgi:hypothetical protein
MSALQASSRLTCSTRRSSRAARSSAVPFRASVASRRPLRVAAYASDISDEAYVCLVRTGGLTSTVAAITLFSCGAVQPPPPIPLQGLAQCFKKDGKSLTPALIVEPLSASTLECLANGAQVRRCLVADQAAANAEARRHAFWAVIACTGARTSYKAVTGIPFGQAMRRERSAFPADFQLSTGPKQPSEGRGCAEPPQARAGSHKLHSTELLTGGSLQGGPVLR